MAHPNTIWLIYWRFDMSYVCVVIAPKNTKKHKKPKKTQKKPKHIY
jgi:hypothetical protein